MNKHQFRINNYKAINEADILLNGITVVSGENGSGKSTMSKFIYELITEINNYEKYLDKEFLEESIYINNTLNKSIKILKKISDKNDINFPDFLEEYVSKNILGYFVNNLNYNSFNDNINFIKQKIDVIKNYFKKNNHSIIANKEYVRFLQIFKNLNNNEINDFIIHLDLLLNKLDNLTKQYKNIQNNRPNDYFIKNLTSKINVKKIKFQITEENVEIIDYQNNTVGEFLFLNKTIYIDSPLALGNNVNNNYWKALNNLLINKNEDIKPNLTSFNFHEIIEGEVSYTNEEFKNKFKYYREDGQEFDIFDCATGLKSFAIIYLLLKNGHLTDKTLLIIDEPEAHLHPQWIVEYARMIVFLNKKIGVKFFIASHNPDMISAIKYIAIKEKTDKQLNFYLAQRTENFTYNYVHLKTDIEPIFAEFNIALDRIDKYGQTDEI